MKRLLKVLCLMFICSLIGVSCGTSLSPSERLMSVLTSEPGCSVPCWRTMVPGKSTEADFLKLVAASPSDTFNDIKHSPLRPEGVEYGWDDDTTGFFAHIRFHNDKATLLSFLPDGSDFSLSMVTEALGQPSAYGMSTLGSEDFFVLLTLIYEREGVVIETSYPVEIHGLQNIEATCEYDIDWNTPQRRFWIYLVEPGTAEEMVQNLPIGGFTIPAHKPQPWSADSPTKLTWCP